MSRENKILVELVLEKTKVDFKRMSEVVENSNDPCLLEKSKAVEELCIDLLNVINKHSLNTAKVALIDDLLLATIAVGIAPLSPENLKVFRLMCKAAYNEQQKQVEDILAKRFIGTAIPTAVETPTSEVVNGKGLQLLKEFEDEERRNIPTA